MNSTCLRAVVPLVLIPTAVIGLASYPILTLLLLSACAWWSLRTVRDRSRRKLFLLAAVFGTIGEAICVYGSWWTPDGRGLWIYLFPSPFGLALKLPIWLPLVWGNLFVLFADLAKFISVRNGLPVRWPEAVRYPVVLIIMVYAGLLFRTIDVRILWVFTPFFAAFLLYWNAPADLAVFIVAALLGSFGELWAMRSGLWIYTKPLFRNEFLLALGIPGVPVSLPMAWGLSAVFLTRWAKDKDEAPHQVT